MRAVAAGPGACDRFSAVFAGWSPEAVVSQVVVAGLDPLLLEVVLGPAEAPRWLPLVRQHYAELRALYPGPFDDVERVWATQRAWWHRFLDDLQDSAATGGAGHGGVDLADDPQPAHEQRRPRRPRSSGARIRGAPSELPAAQPSRVAAVAGSPPPAASGVDASQQLDQPAPGEELTDLPSPASVPRRPRPVVSPPPPRPRVPPLPERPVLASGARPGAASLGTRGRALLEAACVSAAAARRVTDTWVAGDAQVSDWGTWALGSAAVADYLSQRRDRVRSR